VITEEEFRSALETVKRYRLQREFYKLQQHVERLSGETLLSEAGLSTRLRNQLRSIGEQYHLCSGADWANLKLRDFEGLDRKKLSIMRGMGASTMNQVESLLKKAGVRLR